MDGENLGNGILARELHFEVVIGCKGAGGVVVECVRFHVCAQRGFCVCRERQAATLDVLEAMVQWSCASDAE